MFRKRSAAETRGDAIAPVAPGWPLVVKSAVAYALAFNVIFFLQELFLVLPKALTPGLRPTLFHNNHTWSGANPLAALWQGTGAVAIIVTGLVCLAILPALERKSAVIRLLVSWLAYHGLIMGLAQIPIGALLAGADVGMAMTYLRWSDTTKTALAMFALAAIPLVCLQLTRRFLQLAPTQSEIGRVRLRQRFIFKAGAVAALLGTVLVIPFRLPRELAEVIALPVIVLILGIPGFKPPLLSVFQRGLPSPARNAFRLARWRA